MRWMRARWIIHKPQTIIGVILFNRRRHLGPWFICKVSIDAVSRRWLNRIDNAPYTLFQSELTCRYSTKVCVTVSDALLQLTHTDDMLVKVASFWAVQYAPALASHSKERILGMISLRSIVFHILHIVSKCWNIDVDCLAKNFALISHLLVKTDPMNISLAGASRMLERKSQHMEIYKNANYKTHTNMEKGKMDWIDNGLYSIDETVSQ
jgi:hypothetical protein